eukprot:403333761
MRSLFTIALFIAASVSATPDFGGMIKGALHKLSHHLHKKDPTLNWPKVHLPPDNFQAEYIVTQWEWRVNSLIQYKNTSISQSIDSDGNRELVHFRSDVDGHGLVDVQTYTDFNTNIMHQKIESIGVCQKSPPPLPIKNLREYVHKFQDYHEDMIAYIGSIGPVGGHPWDEENHAFALLMKLPNHKFFFGTLFFDTRTLDLKIITLDDYPNFIIKVESIIERKFTDADFKNVECQDGQAANPFIKFTTPMSGMFF